MTDERLILGSLEYVDLPGLGITEVLAKVDTGAFSGALHCTDIALAPGDDGPVLWFTPLGREELRTNTTDFQEITARSASGHESIRYLIPVELSIKGQQYETVIGLSDRSSMKRPMLLGRRFLLEQSALVDVSLTRSMDDEANGLEEES